MMWSLAKEQMRAQRRYVIWTAAMVAVTVGFAVYGAMFATALAKEAARIGESSGNDAEWGTYLQVSNDGVDHGYATVTADELVAALEADARARPQASAVGYAQLQPPPSASAFAEPEPLSVVVGTMDWSGIIAEGRAPGRGEAVVSAAYAQEMGLSVGDLVPLVALQWDDNGVLFDLAKVDFPLTISGLSHSRVDAAGVSVWVPSGYMNGADATAVEAAWVDAINTLTGPGEEPFEPFGTTSYEVVWNGSAPSIVALATEPTVANPRGSTVSSSTTIIAVAAVAVGALFVGVVAMAFAVGRSQAQLRSQWVATARALGATKRHVLAATLAESTVIGTTGAVVGYVLGALATWAHLSLVTSSVAAPAFGATVPFDVWIAGGALVLAITLSLIVGAIPAYWSARVAPTAALKPVTDLSEAEVSRRVKVGPLFVAWLGSTVVFTVFAVFGAPGLLLVVPTVAGVVMLVTGVMVIQETLRWSLPQAGQRMSRSSRRVVMVAGDGICARPRQSTIPAFIMTLAVGVMTAIYLPILAGYAPGWDIEWSGAVPEPVAINDPYAWMALPTIGVVLLATFLNVAISASSSTLTAREAATREALGMTRRDGRVSAALAYAVAQCHGLVLGLAAGIFAGAWFVPSARENPDAIDEWVAHTAVGLLWVALAGLAAIALGAILAGASARATRPVSRIEVSA